jgi:GNAT superfamily N-acetyltransferase
MKTTSPAEAKIEEVFLAPVGTAFGNRTIVVERDGWYQVMTPGSPHGNEVVLSRIEASRADQIVQDVIKQYAELGVPFRWQVGPLTEPADLGDILARHGFTWQEVRGMAIEPAAWRSTPSEVVVERVTRDNLAEYVAGVEQGWRFETPPDPHLADDALPHLDGERFCMFVAKVGGAVAGTAGYVMKPRSAYLTGGNVLQAFRGTGVYRALIDARLRRLAAVGCPLATTQARETTSAPILEHLGWETVVRFRVYRLDDPRVAT